MKLFNLFKNYSHQWKIIGRIGIILWILSFFITVFQILPDIRETKSDIQIIQEKLNTNEAEWVLYTYFFNIEQNNFTGAFDLFTDRKKQGDSVEKFSKWLNNFVAFEWLKIIELKEKKSASKKLFLTEFWFKRRWMKTVNVKWGFYMVYDWKKWKIDYSNVLFEKWYKDWACDFYKFEDYCK